MGVVVAVVLVVAVLATYLTWTAQRLDRLHARVEAAAGALTAQLEHRARAAAAFSAAAPLPPVLAAQRSAAAADAAAATGLDHHREAVENQLVRCVRAATTQPGALQPGTGWTDVLLDASTKVALARRFHNDAVRDARALRANRLPRLLRLSGTAPLPEYFEIDDTPLPLPRPAPAR
jgi:hypothetical protein